MHVLTANSRGLYDKDDVRALSNRPRLYSLYRILIFPLFLSLSLSLSARSVPIGDAYRYRSEGGGTMIAASERVHFESRAMNSASNGAPDKIISWILACGYDFVFFRHFRDFLFSLFLLFYPPAFQMTSRCNFLVMR